MKKITIIAIILFSFLIITNVNAEQVLFERVGKYAIATAGNNNSDRGTSFDAKDYSLILNYPNNWNEIKNKIPESITNRINNMSGSYLQFNGTVIKSWFNATLQKSDDSTTHYDVLIIYPDNSYQIIKKPQNLYCIQEIELTQSGWYYVAILDASIIPQFGWTITTIYENENNSINYMKLIDVDKYLVGGQSSEIYLKSKLPLLGEYQVYGVLAGAGHWAWSYPGETEDSLEAILSDKSYQYLYEDKYNGKVIFEGREKFDFANGTYNTIRSHNIKGGEMDIFNETLSSDYFGGKELVGYRFTKTAKNGSYVIGVIGISQSVESPNLKTESDISKNEDNSVHINVKVKNTTEWEACNTELRIKIDEHLNINSIKNVSYNYDVDYAIDYNTREVVIIFNEQLAKTKDFEINFDVEIETYGNIGLSTSLNYYPSLNHVCENDITSDSAYQINNTSSSILVLLNDENNNNVNNDLVNPQTGTIIPFLIILGFGFLGFGLYKYARNKRLI